MRSYRHADVLSIDPSCADAVAVALVEQLHPTEVTVLRRKQSSPSQPTKVAAVLDAVPPWSKGGRENRYAELFSRWSQHAELEVTVYSMRWWDAAPPGPIRYRAIMPRMSLYHGERRSTSHGVVFALASLQLLFRSFDVILTDQMPYLQIFPLLAIGWLRRTKVVVDWHELWGPEYWSEYLGRRGRIGGIVERAALTVSSVIVADSSHLGQQLLQSGVPGARLVVIPNSIDRRHAEMITAKQDAPDLLYVGRLIAHKRVDVLLRAFAHVVATTAGLRLGVVGVGPEQLSLTSLAAELQLTGNVEFLGTIDSHDEVWALVKGARIFVFPSEREGFGFTVAEALAVGTPVVTSDAIGNESKRLVSPGATGRLANAGDPASFAAAIRELLQSPPTRDAVARDFWAEHRDLDWDVSALRYLELLRGVWPGA